MATVLLTACNKTNISIIISASVGTKYLHSCCFLGVHLLEEHAVGRISHNFTETKAGPRYINFPVFYLSSIHLGNRKWMCELNLLKCTSFQMMHEQVIVCHSLKQVGLGLERFRLKSPHMDEVHGLQSCCEDTGERRRAITLLWTHWKEGRIYTVGTQQINKGLYPKWPVYSHTSGTVCFCSCKIIKYK